MSLLLSVQRDTMVWLIISHSLKRRFVLKSRFKDEAFEHLHRLGLRDQAENLGANRFAERVRSFMIQPLRDAIVSLNAPAWP